MSPCRRLVAALAVVVSGLGLAGTPAQAAHAATAYVIGTLTSDVTGAGVAGVTVDTGPGQSAVTDSDGDYRLVFPDVSAPMSIKICFETSTAFTGPHDAGYIDQCYVDVPWPNPPGVFPPDATRVTVTPGATTRHIDAVLERGGGIAGRALQSNGGGPVLGTTVYIYDSTGHIVGSSGLDAQGRFVANRLHAGDYFACLFRNTNPSATAPGGVFGACFPNARWVYPDDPAGIGAQPITVTAGALTTGIVIRATAAASISGTVTTADSGAGASGVAVVAYGARGVPAGGAYTGRGGTYQILALEPSADGYRVCFDPQRTDRPAYHRKYPFGLVPQCADGVVWNPGGKPPAEARSVPAPSGVLSTGVDAVLATGATIAGRVTDAGTGGNVFNVRVTAYDDTGQFVEAVPTSGSGTYVLRGLATNSTGYQVCFDASLAATPNRSRLSLQSQCYNARPWRPLDVAPSAGARHIPVVQGSAHRGVNAVLEHGGSIAGTVRTPSSEFAYGLLVQAFDAAGRLVATTTASGTYQFFGLRPATAGYRICFDPSSSSYTDLLPECYRNTSWDGDPANVPADAEPVPVTVDVVTTGINATLDSAQGP